MFADVPHLLARLQPLQSIVRAQSGLDARQDVKRSRGGRSIKGVGGLITPLVRVRVCSRHVAERSCQIFDGCGKVYRSQVLSLSFKEFLQFSQVGVNVSSWTHIWTLWHLQGGLGSYNPRIVDHRGSFVRETRVLTDLVEVRSNGTKRPYRA